MNRKVRTALYACALMAPLLLQSCNAQSGYLGLRIIRPGLTVTSYSLCHSEAA